ncbi:helix-turn-helix transcriptional regulator [Candidatus Acetothermia bacterium]|nr:helix-turn-helix transcriptional regulator [Candidatus Acetothermia bacterium]
MPKTKSSSRAMKSAMVTQKQVNRYEEYMKKQFENSEFRKVYEEGLEALRVGVKVAQLREKHGLTQTQLAAMLHTSPSVISRIENGENVELKTLQKIAQALNAKLKIELVPA